MEQAFDQTELTKAIDTFLDGLSPKKRSIFISRYWYTDSISEIAVRHNMSDGAVSMTLSRIRQKLYNYLLERGFETVTNEKLYEVLGDINEKHINEARAYHKAQKHLWVKWAAIAACLCLVIPLTAFAIDIIQYNAAVDYLNSLGIAVGDLSDYSHKEIKEAVKTIDAGESSPLTEEILSLIPENKDRLIHRRR